MPIRLSLRSDGGGRRPHGQPRDRVATLWWSIACPAKIWSDGWIGAGAEDLNEARGRADGSKQPPRGGIKMAPAPPSCIRRFITPAFHPNRPPRMAPRAHTLIGPRRARRRHPSNQGSTQSCVGAGRAGGAGFQQIVHYREDRRAGFLCYFPYDPPRASAASFCTGPTPPVGAPCFVPNQAAKGRRARCRAQNAPSARSKRPIDRNGLESAASNRIDR